MRHPAARRRKHSSGSSPQISAGSKPPASRRVACPVERDAAHRIGRTHGGVPFHVDQPVPQTGPGRHFAHAARDDGQTRIRRQGRRPRLQPARRQHAIAVDELDQIGGIRIRQQQIGPRIARAGGGEAVRDVQIHDPHAQTLRERHAAIGRSTVDIDDADRRQHASGRIQTRPQARPFVATDRDETDGWRERRGTGKRSVTEFRIGYRGGVEGRADGGAIAISGSLHKID